MADEKNKICPKCKLAFTCRPQDIANCGCQTVSISESQRLAIDVTYTDCLCVECLQDILLNVSQKGPIVGSGND